MSETMIAIIVGGVEAVGPFATKGAAEVWAECYIGDKAPSGYAVSEMTDPAVYAREAGAPAPQPSAPAEEQPRSIEALLHEARDVQDACNLSGVVHAFSRSMRELRVHLEKEPGFSTTMLNQHPIAVLFSSKIGSLTGSENPDRFSWAYRWKPGDSIGFTR